MIFNKILITGLLGISLVVSGCGNKKEKNAHVEPSMLSSAIKVVAGLLKPSIAPVDPRPKITRQAIDAAPVAVLFASIKTRNAFATLSRVSQNRDIETWISADGISLSFAQGVLVSTRGLGHDLMAAEISETIKSLKSSRDTALRIHDYLNGEDQIVRMRFSCSFRSAGSENLHIIGLNKTTEHIVESCQNSDFSLENHYWVTASGKILQSRQWVGPEIEYIFTQHLSR